MKSTSDDKEAGSVNQDSLNYVEDDRFEDISKDVKSLLKYRNKTLSVLEASAWVAMCSECDQVKPLRTRHCSVCNRCVFYADLHSPWVNNCIGLENQRFYLLFLFYALLAVSFHMFTSASIWNHYAYRQHMHLMNYLFISDSLLLVVLWTLNLWHWSLAMTGSTTIDVLCGVDGVKSGGERKN